MKPGEKYDKDRINTMYLTWTSHKEQWYYCMEVVIKDAVDNNLLCIPGRGYRGKILYSKVDSFIDVVINDVKDFDKLVAKVEYLSDKAEKTYQYNDKNHTFIQKNNKKLYTLMRLVTLLLEKNGMEWKDYEEEYYQRLEDLKAQHEHEVEQTHF